MLSKAATALTWAREEPTLLVRELNRLYHTRGYRRRYNPDGIDVMGEDWDVMIVLDACRFDLFAERSDLPGELTARESRAAHTSEFILGNFHERDLTDTVYVTASPILRRGYPETYDPTFHAVVDVWREDGWDEACNSVRPETMVTYARRAAEQYPNKRLIVHFMQPHYPFIGSDLDHQSVPDPAELTTDVWNEMMRGNASLSRSAVVEAYRANFDIALPAVSDLFEALSGRIVVTSDHGNMLGERAHPLPIVEWGHPPGLYTPELVTVPWLTYDAGPRPEIVAGAPESEQADDVERAVVRDRLRQLGYAE